MTYLLLYRFKPSVLSCVVSGLAGLLMPTAPKLASQDESSQMFVQKIHESRHN
jgi:hypothetical protein